MTSSQPRLSRRALLLAAGAGVCVPLVGCSTDRGAVTPQADPLDEVDPAAPAFFGQFALPGAREVETYASLEQMSTAATAVAIARVRDVVATRTIEAEGADRVGMVGLVLEPRIVKGRVASSSARRLVVEFVGGTESAAAAASRLRRDLPRANALWFLRAKAEEVDRTTERLRAAGRRPSARDAALMAEDRRYFRLVSSQGFFIQGARRVENPMASAEPGEGEPLIDAAARIERLSQLVARVQAAR